MVTPVVGRSGDIETTALRTLTRKLVEGGVDGLFPCGSNGEFSSLTQDQRATILETVVEEAGSTPVLAGCGGTSVGDVLSFVDDASEIGADAAVIVTPYYLQTTQAGLVDYFEAIADRTSLPIYLYDIPIFTGQRLKPASVAELSEHDSIVGIKDSTGDLVRFEKLLATVPEDFAVFQGTTAYAVPALDMGADGIVPGEGNVVPRRLVEIYEAHRAGDRSRAAAVYTQDVAPITREITSMPTIPAVKYLAAKPGSDFGPPLAPLPELGDDDRSRLDDCFKTHC